MSEPERTIGYLAQVACTWEVLARKAGNVCPGREFPDLSVDDFLKSAAAIAPVLDQAPHQPLGITILRCIEETRKVVDTNTNLCIVLLLAPLASVPLDEPLQLGLTRVLDQTTIEDARHAFAAIRIANPAGLGKVEDQDLSNEPTLPLRTVMELAKGRDLIAHQYARRFWHIMVPCRYSIASRISGVIPVERLIMESQIDLLLNNVDSLISRKLGDARANEVLVMAGQIRDVGGLDTPKGRQAYRDFDTWLRSDNHARNPGTTADLIAAALFVALRENRIPLSMPFVWEQHPFQTA
jgi:triphosphoribosyl-dephospho-CoA synthase